MSRDTSAFTTLDNANMGTREEFRKWWDESGIEFPSIFESGAAQKGWNARQPEIDALTSELQGEMIKVAAQEAIAEALKKLVAVRDKSIESLKAENELNLAANRGLGRLVDVLQAENERLRKDAERYQWLKANCFYYEEPCEAFCVGVLHFESTELTQLPDSLDGVIEAAMKDFSNT